jgi:hypothetical protein
LSGTDALAYLASSPSIAKKNKFYNIDTGLPRGRMENHGRSTPFAWPELYKEGTFKLGSFGVMVTEPFKITWRQFYKKSFRLSNKNLSEFLGSGFNSIEQHILDTNAGK